MFFLQDTTKIFKISYYLVAMFPSFMIFVALHHQEITHYILILSIIVFLTLIGLAYLVYCLEGTLNRYPDKENIKNISVQDINNKTITLLLGIIVPSALINSNNLYIDTAIYVCLQLLIFMMMCRSTNSFTNLMIMLVGWDIYKIEYEYQGEKESSCVFIRKTTNIKDIVFISNIGNSKVYVAYEKR